MTTETCADEALQQLEYNSTALAKKLRDTASGPAHTAQDCLHRKVIFVSSSDRIVPESHQMPADPTSCIQHIQKTCSTWPTKGFL